MAEGTPFLQPSYCIPASFSTSEPGEEQSGSMASPSHSWLYYLLAMYLYTGHLTPESLEIVALIPTTSQNVTRAKRDCIKMLLEII